MDSSVKQYIFNTKLSIPERILVIANVIVNYNDNTAYTMDNKEIDLLIRISAFLANKTKVPINVNLLAGIILLAFDNGNEIEEAEILKVFIVSFYNVTDDKDFVVIENLAKAFLNTIKITCPYLISEKKQKVKESDLTSLVKKTSTKTSAQKPTTQKTKKVVLN